jgi:hypothetical protein
MAFCSSMETPLYFWGLYWRSSYGGAEAINATSRSRVEGGAATHGVRKSWVVLSITYLTFNVS